MISAELATRLTYRDAVKEGKQFIKDFPSACTINRRVIEYGEKIKTFNGMRLQMQVPELHLLMARRPIHRRKGRAKIA